MASRWWLRTGALAGIGVVLIPSLYRGWMQIETDFPNYYTAAALTLQHAPLRNFYDWTWFQRQINYAGWGLQLGGYIPHSPLTMLPMLPLAKLPPMTAKRVWLAVNVAFLFAAIWILANLSALPVSGLLLAAMAGYQALSLNFVFGQYYVFILLLLVSSMWLGPYFCISPGSGSGARPPACWRLVACLRSRPSDCTAGRTTCTTSPTCSRARWRAKAPTRTHPASPPSRTCCATPSSPSRNSIRIHP